MNKIFKWLKFAWKNVWRNKRRSLTTSGITAVGVCGILFFGGFALFTYESLKEFSARQQGHVIVAHKNYFDKEEETPLALGLQNWRELRATMRKDPGVRHVLPRINLTGLITNGDKSTVFLGEGVDPRYEFKMTALTIKVLEGDVLDPDAKDIAQVMVAQDLARNLNAKVGTILTLLSTTTDGALNGIDVKVVGIFGTGVPELDKRKILISLSTAQELLVSNAVSTLSVYLEHTKDSKAYEQTVNTRFPEVSTRTWDDLAFFYHKVRDLYDRIFSVMGVVIIIVVLLSVANTMSMAVIERTREIGTLAALGTLPREMLTNFMLEAAIIGILGSVLGAVLSGCLTLYLQFNEVMMPPPPGMTQGYPLRVYFSATMYAQVVGLMVLVTMAGAFFSARKGVSKPIVEALSHV
jgi:putative ABC transport system permease protein